MLKPTVFLDRDGVLNIDKEYVFKVEDFEWIEGAKQSIKYFNDKKYLVIVITNQSGLTRGFYNEKDLDKLHLHMNKDLKKLNANIDDFYYSPYHPDIINKKYDSLENFRKPNTGMLELASKKWKIDKSRSLMIGDKLSDMECANKFGINGYLFKDGSLLNFVQNIDLNKL
tara:strand:- start:240 stop:749 length:510 start_codon:yes stop_codon:yes gene_type:complete